MAQHERIVAEQIKNLAARIKSLRKKAGYSSAEKFAYQHNINRVQYWRYETGTDLHFSNLVKVIAAFGMTPSEFFSEGFESQKEEKRMKN